jgi:hypothetical protein
LIPNFTLPKHWQESSAKILASTLYGGLLFWIPTPKFIVAKTLARQILEPNQSDSKVLLQHNRL